MRKRHVVETPPWLCHLHIQHQEKELIEMNPITEKEDYHQNHNDVAHIATRWQSCFTYRLM